MYSSGNSTITTAIKSRRVRGENLIGRMEDVRNAYETWSQNVNGEIEAGGRKLMRRIDWTMNVV